MANSKKKGSFLKKLTGNILQSAPILGTIVTNFKENKAENPSGNIKIDGWDVLRMAVSAVILFLTMLQDQL